MFKPIIFSSLYIAAGLCVWGAYSAISNHDTSLNSLASLAMQANQQINLSTPEGSKPIYRYKDENNHWTYTDKPVDNGASVNYEKELVFLKSLPQEVMPTKNIDYSQSIPEAPETSTDGDSKISSLLQQAKNIMKLLDEDTDLVGIRKHQANEQTQ